MKIWRDGFEVGHLGQGRYRLEGKLGRGGVADVYRAWDEQDQREVAIKVLKSEEFSEKMLRRFVAEAATMVYLRHPHILRLFSDMQQDTLDKTGNVIIHYIVMECANGGDLQKRLVREQPLPTHQVLHFFGQVANAVDYAHERGVIHRDLKPSNILFRVLPGGQEELALSDFGLAVGVDASHHTFMHGGTLLYMAPEQILDQAVPASDIFSLGVILYQLCTGRLPFRRDLSDLNEVKFRQPPPSACAINPELPRAFDKVILKALAFEPDQRYSSALQFWRAFDEAVNQPGHIEELSPSRVDVMSTQTGTLVSPPPIVEPDVSNSDMQGIADKASDSDVKEIFEGDVNVAPRPVRRRASARVTPRVLPATIPAQSIPPPNWYRSRTTGSSLWSRPFFKFGVIGVVLVALIAGIVFGTGLPAQLFGPKVLVIEPAKVLVSDTYYLQAVLNPDPQKGEVPSRFLSYKTTNETNSVNVEGRETVNGQSVPVVTQGDIDMAARFLRIDQESNAQQGLQAQQGLNETIIGTSDCSTTVTPDHQVGERASKVTVTVYATCNELVYNQTAAQNLAVTLLKKKASVEPGEGYVQLGNIQTQVGFARISDPQVGQSSLAVSARGFWFYQFTPDRERLLLTMLAGKTQAQARTKLQQVGIAKVISFPSSDPLPGDPTQMSIQVQPVTGLSK